MKFARFAFALAAIALVATLPARADALADLKRAGVLKVAVPQDFPPFGTVGADMKPQGYDIDMAELLAKSLGVKVELVPVTSANRIPYLTTKKVDLVISSLGKNPDREKVIDFSAADIKVTKAEELAGKTVGVTRGSVEDIELAKVMPSSTTVKRYEDNNGTISAFLSGQVELVATGNVVAAAILAKNPPKRPEVKFLIKDSPCYVGLNKGETALMDAVNGAIAKAKKDGSLGAISKKWLGADLPAGL